MFGINCYHWNFRRHVAYYYRLIILLIILSDSLKNYQLFKIFFIVIIF